MRGVLSSRPVCRSVGRLASPPVVSWPPFHFTEMCPGCCWSAAVCKERPPPHPHTQKNPKRLLHQHENKQTPHTRVLSPAWSLCMAAQKKKWPFFIVLACLHSIVARRVQISSFYEPQGSHRPCVAAAVAWSTEAQPSSVLHRQQTPPPTPHPPFTPNLPQCCCCCCRGFPALYAACCVSVCVAVVADRRLFCAWSLSGPR